MIEDVTKRFPNFKKVFEVGYFNEAVRVLEDLGHTIARVQQDVIPKRHQWDTINKSDFTYVFDESGLEIAYYFGPMNRLFIHTNPRRWAV